MGSSLRFVTALLRSLERVLALLSPGQLKKAGSQPKHEGGPEAVCPALGRLASGGGLELRLLRLASVERIGLGLFADAGRVSRAGEGAGVPKAGLSLLGLRPLILVGFLGGGTLPLEDLLTSILFFLFLLLGLELATGLADLLLAGGRVHLAP